MRTNVRRDMNRLSGHHHIGIDDYAQYAPVASVVTLSMAGIKARHQRRDVLALTATSYAAMGLMVQGLKHAVREPRPDSGTRNSFPSGHSATAFMGAELVRMEYGTAAGVAAYGVAAGVGLLRLYNDRHWLNDVVAGAGVGVLSARIAGWLLPLERRLLHWQSDADVVVVPVVDFHGMGFAMSVGF